MSSVFDDILNRAENLNSNNLLAEGSSQVQSMLFGGKGLNLRIPPVSAVASQQSKSSKTEEDLGGEEIEAQVRLQVERAFLNHGLLTNPVPIIQPAAASKREKENVNIPQQLIRGDATRRELVFGDKVRRFIKSNKKLNLSKLMLEAVQEGKSEEDVQTAWRYVAAVYGSSLLGTSDVVKCLELVTRATKALEQEFVDHMKECINRSLAQAQQGGVPSMKALILGYLKVQGSSGAVQEISAASWEVAYLALRAGDITAASEALATLSQFPKTAVLVSALNQLAKSAQISEAATRLAEETKLKLKAEWRHESSTIKNVHQRLLYSCLLGLEVTEASNLEEWLWCKLLALRLDPAPSHSLFIELQKHIAVDLGEEYFLRSGAPGSWLTFFSALALSGQPERAIKVIFDSDNSLDAVHMAILVKENSLLQESRIAAELVSFEDPAHPTKCSLNTARLIAAFTKKFELQDVSRSLDYWYFLKGMRCPSGGDVFGAAVSRAVFLTGQDVEILGRRGGDGQRTMALIDDYNDVDVTSLIEKVAGDSLLGGSPFDAMRLFVLAEKIDKALEVAGTELAAVITNGADTQRATDEANKLIKIAKDRGTASSEAYTSLCFLLDVVAVLKECERRRVSETLHILSRLRLLPVTSEEIGNAVAQFHLLPPRVRQVLPDLCLKVLEVATQGFRDAENEKERAPLRQLAQALPLYAASVPYSFPTHVNAKMLELQANLS